MRVTIFLFFKDKYHTERIFNQKKAKG